MKLTNRFLAFALLSVVGLLASASPCTADAIYRRGSNSPLSGDITSISRTEVVLTGRTNKKEYRIPANEIERVRWESENPQVSQNRIEERNGQFDKAIAGYQTALKDAANDNMRTDLEFHIARATAAKALKDEDKFDDAITLLEKFRTAHSNSFRYFDALRLLAQIAMAKGDVEKGNAALQAMAEAPWTDFKMETDILKAKVALAHDDVGAALKALDGVISVTPGTAAEKSRRYEALLTKASCLQKQTKYQQATDVLTGILDEAADEDTKTLAETCIRLGDCYQAGGRTKEAILAYLRVDILFPKEKKQHAESLYYLSRLFAQDGKPDKASDAAARLQEHYPRSPWTARLTAAPK
ncbi:MAG TPA: tetratricopeptide repeat protein [Planctomycetaceae bacterium]|jgi:tetratricopeptide (TPR) repeat protein|nr:tetratricopeptide repeat protein [Planctomycetaceae bacterium]